MENDPLRDLLERNQASLEILDKRLRKIERHFFWGTTMNIIKWIVIVVPIVFGVIYISPYVKQYAAYLQPALKLLKLDLAQDQTMGNNTNVSQLNDSQTSSVIETLCDPQKREILIQQICK
ncbi:MAG: hypothetical protein WC465_01660 [Patescibacteria group bacterium]